MLERVLLDDGYPRDGALTLSEMAALVPVRRVLRLEQVAEEILEERPTIEQFEETLRGRLESAEAAAFKSIAAYRCGLRLRPARHAELRVQGDEAPVRLVDRATIELMLWHALDVAGRRGLPIQFHCGFGDADLHLPDADPTLLGGIAHGWPAVPLVLLHNWPYARGAGWMASVHPNVYADFGLAVPFCSTRGMQATLSELLHVGPLSKVLYSSDASRIPELYWLGSRHARRVLGQVLEGCVRDGDLTASQAERAAADILRGNAARLYGIG